VVVASLSTRVVLDDGWRGESVVEPERAEIFARALVKYRAEMEPSA
jgi:hypothetical protein